MASNVAADEHDNTETEEGTIARQKKRSRRVSFAEMTSVHIFDRDEEDETPQNPKPNSDDIAPPELEHSGDDLGFQQDPESSRDEEEGDEGQEEIFRRRAFLRPTESPSPGSTVGSATSNDEDNFFGPVSTSFIRPGRLSDSAASDENHDITMDSTAFSMHFRSLARSESGVGDSKTPTVVHLSFEENTPVHTNVGSSMVLTGAKKPIFVSSMPVTQVSCGNDSNDMSLVGENPHRYDYDRLSPGLDALLAEGSKDVHTISSSHKISASTSPSKKESKILASKEHGGHTMDLTGGRNKEAGAIDTYDMSIEAVYAVHNYLGEINASASPITFGLSSRTSMEHPDASTDHQNWSPNQLNKGMLVDNNGESVKDAFELRRPDPNLSTVSQGNPSNLDNDIRQSHGVTQPGGETPVAQFISSSSAKGRQILSNNDSPSKYPLIVTPSHMIHNKSTSSIQKSVSKLQMLEASPFSSTLNAKIDSLKLRSLDHLLRTPPFDSFLEKRSNDPQVKDMDATVTRSVNTYRSRIETLKNIGEVSYTKESAGLVNSGKSPHQVSGETLWTNQASKFMTGSASPSKFTSSMNYTEESAGLVNSGNSPHQVSGGILWTNKPSKLTTAAASPFKFTSSGKKMQQSLLASEDPTGGTLVTSGTDSSFAQDNELVNFGPDQDAASKEVIIHTSLSTTNADKVGSLVMEWTTSPMIEINNFKDLPEVYMTDDGETNLHDQRKVSGIGDFLSPLRYKEFQKFQSQVPNGNLKSGRDVAKFKNDIPGVGIKAASPLAEPSRENLVERVIQSPARKELFERIQNDNMNSVVEDVPYPKFNELTNGFERCSPRKRRNEEIILKDRDNEYEIAMIQRSSKLHKGGGCDSELVECPSGGNSETSMTGNESKHWSDIYLKFSTDTKHLLSPSIYKLNLQEIDVLEDILVHLQRLKTYEMLCTEIQSQKTFEQHRDLRQARVAETRMLLHRIVHEQAKLLLMRVKREKLLKKLQLMSSGIQECQMLKLISLSQVSVACTRDAQVDDGQPQSMTANLKGIQEVANDKVAAMGHVLEVSDRKIINLIKAFHSSCKIKGEPNCAATISLVNDHLMKRACCRSIRLDLQLWAVDTLESRHGHCNVILNYLGSSFKVSQLLLGQSQALSFQLN
ncbi:unnamed protein product [Ilex paraguariensis]|uniref:Uncharacterized protein n=1 Tax=Ilex paraguariensis TaxID=185542 RepID=A0ABC8TD13_9AQUA